MAPRPSFYASGRAPLALVLLLPFVLTGCGGTPKDDAGREAATWVVARGGTVVLLNSEKKLTERGQIPERDFAIGRVDLTGADISDADLEQLVELGHLESLTLVQTKITDAGLESIAKIGSLVELDLSYTPVTDDGIAKLSGLRRLKKLFLNGTPVTDDGARALRQQRSGLTIVRLK